MAHRKYDQALKDQAIEAVVRHGAAPPAGHRCRSPAQFMSKADAFIQHVMLKLAVFIDLYSRKVVGWALNTHMKSELIETALKRAL